MIALLAAALLAQSIELKLGHIGPPGSLFAVSSEEFARRVNEKLKGKVVVRVFGSGRLGDDSEMLQKVKLGTLDFALPSTVLSSVVPAFGLFDMPYLVQDREHMKRIEKAIVWPQLAPAAEAAGYHLVAVWENGFRQITNNRHRIDVPEDLKGLKLRVPKGSWRVKMFEAYGAKPSMMSLSEVYVALQTGAMDGEENPLTQIYYSKFQEVQAFLSLTDHVYSPAYLVVAPRKWAALPPEVRKTLEETARQLQPFIYQTAARMDRELLDKLIAAGIQVNRADKEAFGRASKPVYQEFGTEVSGGAALVKKAIALRAAK